jgi:hypothetical protein
MGTLPTEKVAWAKAEVEMPRSITAAINRVFAFM